ncbi:reverse transcriptase domain-containing protein, partial [Tanacetum coccineum]
MTVVTNKKNELVPTRTVTGWRVFIDYRKLNEATRKDHFPLPFMDQMLERLAGNKFFFFLDGFSGYFQILIKPSDQDKTIFTCPYGTYAYKRMPFGLCNAPATFQRCMIANFQDMLKTSMEVFMDDFSVFGDSFDSCLINLEQMLIRCKQAHLVLKWEKCHFMVTKGIMLGHKVSSAGLEVDKVKIDVIAKLLPPTNVKAVRSFLGHAGFYRRFIKYFSKISRPMTKLLEKDVVFDFNKECIKAFESLKEKLTNVPIMVLPDWSQPFELMCNASDFAVGAVLGQRKGKHFIPFHFEFDIEIKNKKGAKNIAADYLSRLENLNLEELRHEDIDDNFPDETLMIVSSNNGGSTPWFADFANYLVAKILRKELKHYFLDEPYLFKMCPDEMIRRCVYGSETQKILDECHHGPTGGHYGPSTTTKKVFDAGFYWPTIFKEAHTLVQRYGSLSRPFPKYHKFEYILVAIDYVSKWAEAGALPTNDARVVINFLKKLFCRFGIPKALISDRGTHFYNKQMEKILNDMEFIIDNPSIWSRKLDNALWAFHTAYKTPIGTTPYRLLYGKTCHLPLEIEHRAYWGLRSCNPDLKIAGEKRFLQLHELDELRLQAYKNSKLYKARTKAYHDKKLRIRKEFKARDKGFLYNSKYKFKAPNLRSKWYRPFMVKHGFPSGYVELYDKHRGSFIVNGYRVKLYHDEEQINKLTTKENHLIGKEGKMKSIPFMAPFLVDYRKTMPWIPEKPFIYSVVENTCNESKLYDLDETGEGIIKGNFLYVKNDLSDDARSIWNSSAFAMPGYL